MPKIIRILTLGLEGGRVDVVGHVQSGVWRYRVIVHDQTALFLDEPDLQPTTTKTRWLDTWREAVKALDRHRWCHFSPIAVDPRFRQRLRASVRRRLPRTQRHEWRRWSHALDRRNFIDRKE